MMGYGMMGGFGLFGLLFNLAIIVGVVVLIVWAAKHFSASSGSQSSSGPSPRDIARSRYARGELTREQYQQMLDDLR